MPKLTHKDSEKIKANLKRENTQEKGRECELGFKKSFKHNKFKHNISKYNEINKDKIDYKLIFFLKQQ